MPDSKDLIECYKVVTEEMKSLGLRNNPNILEYVVGEWTVEENPIAGKCDEGGIWAATSLLGAKKIGYYVGKRYGTGTRIFKARANGELHRTPCRIKVREIVLEEEVV